MVFIFKYSKTPIDSNLLEATSMSLLLWSIPG